MPTPRRLSDYSSKKDRVATEAVQGDGLYADVRHCKKSWQGTRSCPLSQYVTHSAKGMLGFCPTPGTVLDPGERAKGKMVSAPGRGQRIFPAGRLRIVQFNKYFLNKGTETPYS